MADWTTIPDAAIAEGQPVRDVNLKAMRDNPIAITEGATGAPRIRPAAFRFACAAGNTNTRFDHDLAIDTNDTSSANGTRAYWFSTPNDGSARFMINHQRLGGSGSSRVNIMVNGTVEATIESSGGGVNEQTADVSFAANARILIAHRGISGADGSRITRIRILTAGQRFWVFPYGQRFD